MKILLQIAHPFPGSSELRNIAAFSFFYSGEQPTNRSEYFVITRKQPKVFPLPPAQARPD